MATSSQFQERIEAFVRQLAEEWGEVDASLGVCWLDAIENQALEISDQVHAELVKLKAVDRPAASDESVCPECGQPGQCQGTRRRELLTRRGAVEIAEPQYYCPSCRRAFFPDDGGDRR